MNLVNSETKLFGGIILATVALVVGAIFFLSRPSNAKPVRADEKLLLGAHSYKIATDSATATLVEFGDYQCPACGAYSPVVDQVMKDFAGSLNFVFREYPLTSIHANAQYAAQAAQAAGLQGKYFEMHHVLYQKQSEWSEGATDKAKQAITGYAKDIGLDMEQFAKDVDSDAVKNAVTADVRDGDALGINSTPTFYLNGIKMVNPQSVADFESLVREAVKTPTATPAK